MPGIRGDGWGGAGENDRAGVGRVLTGAAGSGGAATRVVGPVGRGALDDDAVEVRGAGGAGLDAAGVAAACRLCVAGWVRVVELVGGALAVVAGAGVVVG
ncbi:MAG TPA: hypothetical protein VFH80_34185, partial [Solirubrobacteraceae bacterium]|nr:hypothetical protein [Solirubrobacteraceae bacterium]